MRLACVVAMVCQAVAPPLCFAQDESAPLFRTGTRLVQVDVVARDQAGPIRGLTKDDFQVFDNGVRQEIAIFAVREAEAATGAGALPPGAVSNRPDTKGEEPVAATVLLIDRLNTDFADQTFARDQAMKYLERASPRDWIAVYSLNATLRVLQEFTPDRELLHAAIERSFGETPAINMEILNGLADNAAAAARAEARQRRNDGTTAAFETIARHLKGLPGRKKLVWITAAPPLTFTEEYTRNDVPMTEYTNLSPPLYNAMKLMNDANVAVYPIDARGLFPGFSFSDPGITTMIRLAELTGGKAFYADNDLVAGIEQAVDDTEVTYTLAFYTGDEEDGAMHSLRVEMERPGMDLRYRRNYSSKVPQKEMTEKQMQAALNILVHGPLAATDISMTARARPVLNQTGYYVVEVAADPSALQLEHVDGRWKGSIDLAIAPDVPGKVKGLRQTIAINLTDAGYVGAVTNGFVIVNAIKVTNDKGKLISDHLRVVLMDRANGNAGSVKLAVE